MMGSRALEIGVGVFVAAGLAVNDGDTYLALALSEKTCDPPPETRRTRFRKL